MLFIWTFINSNDCQCMCSNLYKQCLIFLNSVSLLPIDFPTIYNYNQVADCSFSVCRLSLFICRKLQHQQQSHLAYPKLQYQRWIMWAPHSSLLLVTVASHLHKVFDCCWTHPHCKTIGHCCSCHHKSQTPNDSHILPITSRSKSLYM